MNTESLDERCDMKEVLQGIEMETLDGSMKEMVNLAYNSAKMSYVSRGISSTTILYWGLFGVLILLMLNMVFEIVHIGGFYYTAFCSAIMFNFWFIWLKNYKDQLDDVRSVSRNWDVLPKIGKASFMKNIRAKIAEKALSGGIHESLLQKLRIMMYIMAPLLVGFAIWQDRGFSMRSFLIFLLSLMLISILHMHVSVEKEWHSLKIMGDQELLESYEQTLSEGYYRIMILTAIMITVIVVFGSWLVLGHSLSQVWDKLF